MACTESRQFILTHATNNIFETHSQKQGHTALVYIVCIFVDNLGKVGNMHHVQLNKNKEGANKIEYYLMRKISYIKVTLNYIKNNDIRRH